MALRDLWLQRDSLSPPTVRRTRSSPTRPVQDQLDRGRQHPGPLQPGGVHPATFTHSRRAQHLGRRLAVLLRRGLPPAEARRAWAAATLYRHLRRPAALGSLRLCTTDQPTAVRSGPLRRVGLLHRRQRLPGFPTNTPLENLQVTVAHEYYHATQFAYDFADDGWAMEAHRRMGRGRGLTTPSTTTSSTSPTARSPTASGRWTSSAGCTTTASGSSSATSPRRSRRRRGGLPEIILDFWKAADSSKGAKKDKYFTQGDELGAGQGEVQEAPAGQAFALFADANRRAKSSTTRAQVNNYPQRKLSGQQEARRQGLEQDLHGQARPPDQLHLPLPAQGGRQAQGGGRRGARRARAPGPW